MIPFFFKLKEDIISDDLKNDIINMTFDNMDLFTPYEGLNKKLDGNYLYRGDKLTLHDEVQRLVKSCILECYPIVILHYPYTEVIKHIDDSEKRQTAISTPLFPITNYSPTLFWNRFKDTAPAAICSFEDMKPAIFNTKAIHNLKTTESFRINFQLSFSVDISIIVKLYQDNTLFKK